MAKSSPVAEAMQAVADAVHDLRADLAAKADDPFVPHGGPLRTPRWMAIALRLCVDVDTGESLAQQLKRVPDDYLTDEKIRCVCGATVPRQELAECPGSCGRWFVADESGAWAVRLPEPAE